MNTLLLSSQRQAGFTLIELMIALVLGLILVGGVVGVFLFNRQIYQQSENLARLQENGRQAFEVMGNDLRQAGGIACGSNLTLTNALTNPASNWWSSWNDGTNNYNGLRGFESADTTFPVAIGTGTAARASGTDAVLVLTGTSESQAIITAHAPTAVPPTFTVNSTSHGFQPGDILVACDYGKAAIFQMTGPSGTPTASIEHATGSPPSPGNSGTLQQFQAGGQLAKLSANGWYIGYNARGGKSLYRVKLISSGGNAATLSEEVAEGISNLQVKYLAYPLLDANNHPVPDPSSDYVDADTVADWTKTGSARLTFTLETVEKAGTGNQPITRTWMSVVSLRNRSS